MANTLGLDIGGANLKACLEGRSWSRPFALWRAPDALASELGRLLEGAAPFDRVALTMTAELCDCFATKADGVRHVLDAVASAVSGRFEIGDGKAGARNAIDCGPVAVWSTQGAFISPAEARDEPLRVAAGNWHALATYLAMRAPAERTLVVDVGSTTTDLTPLDRGGVAASGRTDMDRLAAGELLYQGATRTPLMALGPELAWRGRPTLVMNEHFATMADACVVWGLREPEDPAVSSQTADGRPMTRVSARARLLRMVGADVDQCDEGEAVALAGAFLKVWRERLGLSALRATGLWAGPGRGGAASQGAADGLDAAGRTLRHRPAAEALPEACHLASVSAVVCGAGADLAADTLTDLGWPGQVLRAGAVDPDLTGPCADNACAYAVSRLRERGEFG